MNDTNNIILSLDHFSLVIPAKNEAASLNSLLPALRDRYGDIEIIVVDVHRDSQISIDHLFDHINETYSWCPSQQISGFTGVSAKSLHFCRSKIAWIDPDDGVAGFDISEFRIALL